MALTSASCVFNTLLPIYMVAELKLTMRSLGMFEGEGLDGGRGGGAGVGALRGGTGRGQEQGL
jgi:hypothetical protein